MTTYNKEFRDQALKLSDDMGLKKASDQLGVKYSTLSGWRRNRNKQSINTVQQETTPLTDRELKLQQENQELKQANEILKDALGFFAKDRKK